MTSRTVTTLESYKNTGPSRKYVFTCNFNTAAAIEMKPETASSFINIYTFIADEAVEVLMPQAAEYRTTGDSEITVTYDA